MRSSPPPDAMLIRCGVCGRKHKPKLCKDSPKSADDWRYVTAARRSLEQR
jgi:hypothetical protein